MFDDLSYASNIANSIIKNVAQNPDAIAFDNMSYLQLAQLMCGLSEQITGERVLIACSNRFDAYVGMLAALHSGSTYAPVDMTAPIARRNLIIEKFRPTDMITSANDNTKTKALKVGKISKITEAKKTQKPAYVIFTSGSTGEPKGVVISRRAMDHFVDWCSYSSQITASSRVSQHPNIAFDLSVMDIFCGLANGAQLFPIEGKLDKIFPGRAIKKNALTHWISVPSVVDLMMQDTSLKSGDFDTVEKMIFCGEPLLERHLEFIFKLNPRLTVLNTYGPTEATVCMTQIEFHDHNWRSKAKGSLPIGSAIPGMKLELLNEFGESDSAGEIVLSGPQIAQGYWENPELSALAFKNNRYFTGDIGAEIDGNIYFKGRKDHQIKLNGYRIELSDIESTASRLIGKRVACICQRDEIIAFIETQSDIPEGFQNKLHGVLPNYMVPSKIIAIEHLPRNANDKIDYNFLNKQFDRGIGFG